MNKEKIYWIFGIIVAVGLMVFAIDIILYTHGLECILVDCLGKQISCRSEWLSIPQRLFGGY